MKLLIRNGHVIRWNAQNRVEQLKNHHILVENNTIMSVAATLPAELQVDETIDASGWAS